MRKNLIYIILATISLPLIIFAGNQIVELISRAAPQPAKIIIDTKNNTGVLNPSWEAFAQGGEEPPPMLTRIVTQLRTLKPRYVRLDHIYDSYSIVQKNGNNFVYDFSRLDQTVNDILDAGALPFFSLSYMPRELTGTDSVIDTPVNWDDWKNLVQATVEHYSGKKFRNLNNVYYEVWNEPELPQFGNWSLSGNKDYRMLYYYAQAGAALAQDVNKFYIGGPAVGSYYPSWVNSFLSYISQNNLRLDFYSWHRYTKRPSDYVSDIKNTRNKLSNFPKYKDIPLILSEWGLDSANSEMNNSDATAAFTVNTIAEIGDKVDLAFAFEIKDGPPPGGGKWGLITHENGNPPLSPKPRFRAFEALADLDRGNKIYISGQGTFVKAIATNDANTIRVLLSNYDLTNNNTENVPVTFTGLSPSSYNLKYKYPLTQSDGNYEITSTTGAITKNIPMPPNSIVYLELSPVSPLATFIPGASGKSEDEALVLQKNSDPLVFSSPEFHLLPSGKISFYIKPLWDKNDTDPKIIFEAPFATESGALQKIFLRKESSPSSSQLTFGIENTSSLSSNPTIVTLPAYTLQDGSWHRITVGWDPNQIYMFLDDTEKAQLPVTIDIRNGRIVTFYPVNDAIDNLSIVLGKEQLIGRTFDGRVDR